MQQPEEVLGLRPGAGADDCRAAYRRLVREHHPDAHPDATPLERQQHAAELRKVTAAWEALTLRRAGLAGPSGPGGPWAGRADVDDDGDHDVDDLGFELDDLLGDGADESLGHPGLGRAPAVIAMGLVGASFVTFCFSVVLSHSALWQIAVALGVAALLSFILLPFFVMLRSHR